MSTAPSQPLAHIVYFSLEDSSPAKIEQLIQACHRDLSGHPGTVYFSVGKLNPDLKRPVNDLDFDVALHVVFEDRLAHDRYQSDPRHLRFIEENKPTWKKVRVFDSDLYS
jgi:hypothetical protein